MKNSLEKLQSDSFCKFEISQPVNVNTKNLNFRLSGHGTESKNEEIQTIFGNSRINRNSIESDYLIWINNYGGETVLRKTYIVAFWNNIEDNVFREVEFNKDKIAIEDKINTLYNELAELIINEKPKDIISNVQVKIKDLQSVQSKKIDAYFHRISEFNSNDSENALQIAKDLIEKYENTT